MDVSEASPRPWFVNGHSIEANDPDGLWLQNEKTGRGVVANLPSCPKSRMSSKNRKTWDAIVEANARLIVDAVNERDRLLAAMKAIEDLCKVLDRTDLWEAREEYLDDAIYEIREKAREAIGEERND